MSWDVQLKPHHLFVPRSTSQQAFRISIVSTSCCQSSPWSVTELRDRWSPTFLRMKNLRIQQQMRKIEMESTESQCYLIQNVRSAWTLSIRTTRSMSSVCSFVWASDRSRVSTAFPVSWPLRKAFSSFWRTSTKPLSCSSCKSTRGRKPCHRTGVNEKLSCSVRRKTKKGKWYFAMGKCLARKDASIWCIGEGKVDPVRLPDWREARNQIIVQR